MIHLQCDSGTLHGGAEVVPYIAITVYVGIVEGDHATIVGITLVGHGASPAVCIGTKHKILLIAITVTICHFIGNSKVPVVPVVDTGAMVHKLQMQQLVNRNSKIIRESGPPTGTVIFSPYNCCSDVNVGSVTG